MGNNTLIKCLYRNGLLVNVWLRLLRRSMDNKEEKGFNYVFDNPTELCGIISSNETTDRSPHCGHERLYLRAHLLYTRLAAGQAHSMSCHGN
jgi:hypothetical protein